MLIPHLTSQDLRRHFPANFRRALNLDEGIPATAVHGPFSSLLARLGLEGPVPPSPRSQPSFLSPRRGQRHSRPSRSSRGSSHDGGSFEVDSADDERRRQHPKSRRAISMSMSTPSRPSRKDRPAPSTSDRQKRMGRTAPPAGGKTEFKRWKKMWLRVLV